MVVFPLQGSECTMVCNDFARLGYDYVVVDAGVQLTYDWNLAREMMAREYSSAEWITCSSTDKHQHQH